MSLRDRLGATGQGFAVGAHNDTTPDAANAAITPTRAYQETKARIHQVLLGRLDLEAMENLTPESLKEELRQMVERLLIEENLVLNAGERRNLVRDIQYEMLGFGPLEPLLADPTVSDILVNTHKQVYVERRGKLELSEVTFTDDD
jgi:pilus assembly protein CpaF